MPTIKHSTQLTIEDQEIRELFNEYQQMKMFFKILRKTRTDKFSRDIVDMSTILTKSQRKLGSYI